MAGMLPGVECARRRRFHTSSAGSCYSPSTNNANTVDDHNSTITTFRHPLFYPTNFESLMLSSSSHSLKQRSHVLNDHAYTEHNLGGEAREAKQRLDEKFRAQWKFDENPKRKGLFRGLWRLHLR